MPEEMDRIETEEAPSLMPATRSGSGPHALFFRMAVVNLGALALLGAAFGEGWAQLVFTSDSTGLTWVIAIVFAVGLGLSLLKGWKLSCEVECARTPDPCPGTWAREFLNGVLGRSSGARAIAASVLRMQVVSRIAPVRHIASALVLLGLVGTVVGFILALSGISVSMSNDVGAVAGMITRLIAGMSVALYTTLEGAVLSLWLTVNHQILSAGAASLISGLVAMGERHARN
jgi:hypothetical protein